MQSVDAAPETITITVGKNHKYFLKNYIILTLVILIQTLRSIFHHSIFITLSNDVGNL